MNHEELVMRYRQLRDRKVEMQERHKEELAPVNKLMQAVENRMLKEMLEEGFESIKTKAGTAYKTTRTSASVADRTAFLDFVREEGMWEMLESRANKLAVEAYREETGDLPPGINWREDVGVNFRK